MKSSGHLYAQWHSHTNGKCNAPNDSLRRSATNSPLTFEFAESKRRAPEPAKKMATAPLLIVSLVFHAQSELASLPHVQELTSAFLDTSVELEFHRACRFNSIKLLERIWSSCSPESEASPADRGPGHSETWSRRRYLRSDRYYNRYQFRLAMIEAVKLPDLDVIQWLFDHFQGCVVPNQAVEYAAAHGNLKALEFWHKNGVPAKDYDGARPQAQERPVVPDVRMRNRGGILETGGIAAVREAINGHPNVPGRGLPMPNSEGLQQFLNRGRTAAAAVGDRGEGAELEAHRLLSQLLLNQAIPAMHSAGNQTLLNLFRGDDLPVQSSAGDQALEQLLRGELMPVTNDNGDIGFVQMMSDPINFDDEFNGGPPADPSKIRIRWGGHDTAAAMENKRRDVVFWLDRHTYSTRNFSSFIEAAVTSGDLKVLNFLQKYYSVLDDKGLMQKAAAVGHLKVMKWLFGHNYKDSGAAVVRAAVKIGRQDLVEWLIKSKLVEAGRAVSSAVVNGQLEMAQKLHARYWKDVSKQQYYPLKAPNKTPREFKGWICQKVMLDVAEKGRLDIVQWIVKTFGDNPKSDLFDEPVETRFERYPEVSGYVNSMESLAKEGHLEVLKYLLNCGMECPPFTTEAMDQAAANNHLDMVKWLHTNRNEGCTKLAMDLAASNGHLEVVRWLDEKRSEGCTTEAMDHAAKNGHLDVVKWLQVHRKEGCTTEAMDRAAQNGHLEIVQWLHENRSEGCTTKAMDYAARMGHLDIVKWLHENRKEGCTTEAMDSAAHYGKLDVVKWLHENRFEGCTTAAMDLAAAKGHFRVVKWLHEHRTEGCTSDAMDNAAIVGDFELVLYLHSQYIEGCTDKAFDKPPGLDDKHHLIDLYGPRREDIYEWLDEYYPEEGE